MIWPLLKISFPLEEPVLIFALVLVIILVAPPLFQKLRMPEIIGLILAGVAVGPHGLNLLSEDLEFSIFGTIGLLYLMFLAGLEIDVKDFRKNKEKSITFGVLTFSLPFGFTLAVTHFALDFSWMASLLISAMIATHTLVSYPIVSNLGISRNRVINVGIGGTIITDTVALLILAVIAESTQGDINLMFWLRFLLYFSVFVFIVNWVFPRLSRWFFRNYDGQSSLEYVFVLTVVFISAVVAEFAHIEPIIGAFFAGLALNRLIPHNSPLMNRIMFIGHTLFIPFFLISVGMLVDFGILFESRGILLIIGVLFALAVISKYLAAYLTQKIFRYTLPERHLLFGLSNARAASAIAIIIVGFNMGIVQEGVMNATIILVLFTCLISSLVTERSGKKIAYAQQVQMPDLRETEERILIPVSKPDTIPQLVSFAVMIKNRKSEEPLFPITIVPDDEKAAENVAYYSRLLEKAQVHASATDHMARIISRVDTNVADGLARSIKELHISKLVMGWHGRMPTVDFFFGTLLENLLMRTGKAVYVVKLLTPVNLIDRIHVMMPPAVEYEVGFRDWVTDILDVSRQTNSSVLFWGHVDTHTSIRSILQERETTEDIDYREMECGEILHTISGEIAENDLLVVVKARRNTLSYNKELRNVPELLDRYFNRNNIVVLYPEQEIVYKDALDVQV
jgi:Kef-type K+ transport system membrane component KefB